mmetsp:Transcript_13814/g.18494  ORF Transcript_13814/g.18494 Transcript_13814/m.18494 type:complete len:314 (+) Transcript_13814:80-1021(+)
MFGSWRHQKKTEETSKKHNFEKGDHVIRWTHLLLYPIQVHGIVLSAGEDIVTIVDFGLAGNANTSRINDAKENLDEKKALKERTIDCEDVVMVEACKSAQLDRVSIVSLTEPEELKPWKKVNYEKSSLNKNWWSRGSIEKENEEEQTLLPSSDPPNLVIARVRYLLTNPSVLPKHHLLFSNSECIAVWCKTSRWSTLQTSVFLHSTAAGNLKSAATLATVATTTTVTTTIPASGIAGWFGMTTTTSVGLLTAQPWLIPVLAGYGIITVGTPIIMLKKAKERWALLTTKLNDGFWAWADSDIYVEAIHCWSGLK